MSIYDADLIAQDRANARVREAQQKGADAQSLLLQTMAQARRGQLEKAAEDRRQDLHLAEQNRTRIKGTYGRIESDAAAARKIEADAKLEVEAQAAEERARIAGAKAQQEADRIVQLEEAAEKAAAAREQAVGPKSAEDLTDISQTQSALNEFFGGKLEVDGVAGPKTVAAVKEFQKMMDLPVTGVLTPAGAEKLYGAAAQIESDRDFGELDVATADITLAAEQERAAAVGRDQRWPNPAANVAQGILDTAGAQVEQNAAFAEIDAERARLTDASNFGAAPAPAAVNRRSRPADAASVAPEMDARLKSAQAFAGVDADETASVQIAEPVTPVMVRGSTDVEDGDAEIPFQLPPLSIAGMATLTSGAAGTSESAKVTTRETGAGDKLLTEPQREAAKAAVVDQAEQAMSAYENPVVPDTPAKREQLRQQTEQSIQQETLASLVSTPQGSEMVSRFGEDFVRGQIAEYGKQRGIDRLDREEKMLHLESRAKVEARKETRFRAELAKAGMQIQLGLLGYDRDVEKMMSAEQRQRRMDNWRMRTREKKAKAAKLPQSWREFSAATKSSAMNNEPRAIKLKNDIREIQSQLDIWAQHKTPNSQAGPERKRMEALKAELAGLETSKIKKMIGESGNIPQVLAEFHRIGEQSGYKNPDGTPMSTEVAWARALRNLAPKKPGEQTGRDFIYGARAQSEPVGHIPSTAVVDAAFQTWEKTDATKATKAFRAAFKMAAEDMGIDVPFDHTTAPRKLLKEMIHRNKMIEHMNEHIWTLRVNDMRNQGQ